MRHKVLLSGPVETPLGRFLLSGEIREGRGVFPRRPFRLYGHYAIMILLKGEGSYQDANGFESRLHPNDLTFVFPDVGHWYGTRGGATWDEIHLTFDGPVFDLWRSTGLLSPHRPVVSLTRLDWIDNLRSLIDNLARPAVVAERINQTHTFLSLLTELLPGDAGATTPDQRPEWLILACGLLSDSLSQPIEPATVAESIGLSYETFRKRFQQAMGISPARYRAERRIEAAKGLLRFSPQMTNRQVAEALGFFDEYHFSRRFKEITGLTPKDFRLGGASVLFASVLGRDK